MTQSVLLAASNLSTKAVIDRLLMEYDVHLTYVTNGPDAFAAASVFRYELIMLDMQLPELSGPSVTKRIRGIGGFYLRAPIVGLSDDASWCRSELPRSIGMSRVLLNPLEMRHFNKVLAELPSLQHGRVLH